MADGAVAVTDDAITYAGERGSLPADWVGVAAPEGWRRA